MRKLFFSLLILLLIVIYSCEKETFLKEYYYQLAYYSSNTYYNRTQIFYSEFEPNIDDIYINLNMDWYNNTDVDSTTYTIYLKYKNKTELIKKETKIEL